ncbi:hypothetical protein, conserved [Eimeria praecox]|uniref:SSD domain-containing protein n=1 Tax=Eimeria praecox TaxID=51316 RepID=U6H5M3_9EIME|nr:hypothetical protein, conserved [Eimeria praecox]
MGAAVVALLLLLQALFVGGLLGIFSISFDVVTLMALFASGALTVEYTTLVVYTHLRTSPLFASAPLPSLSVLSSIMQQHQQHQQLLQLQQQQQQQQHQQLQQDSPHSSTAADFRVYPHVSPVQQHLPAQQASAPTSPWLQQQGEQQQQQQQQQQLLLPREEEVCLSCGKRPEGCMLHNTPTATTVEVLLAGLHRQRHQGPLLSFLALREAGPSILMSAVSTFLEHQINPFGVFLGAWRCCSSSTATATQQIQKQQQQQQQQQAQQQQTVQQQTVQQQQQTQQQQQQMLQGHT